MLDSACDRLGGAREIEQKNYTSDGKGKLQERLEELEEKISWKRVPGNQFDSAQK